MQLDELTTYKNIDNYFNLLCHESKNQILEQLFIDKRKIIHDIQNFQQQLSRVFIFLYNNFDPQQNVVKSLEKLFFIDRNTLLKLQGIERITYLQQCVNKSIIKQLNVLNTWKKQNEVFTERTQNKGKKFEWIDLKTRFNYLKQTFEQILLEKVREFDTELTDLVNQTVIKRQSQIKKNLHEQEVTLAKTQSKVLINKLKIDKNQQSKMQKIDFSNVSIRDTTKFLMNKWGPKEQKEFIEKKLQLRKEFHKTSNIPVIFQFVKKYTETTKARDHLINRWEANQYIKEEELRYLCATSIFLNKTINKSQKQNIKQKIHMLHGGVLSKLQFNIAEKIIQTYRQFTNKVADLRKNYYLQMTQQTKQIQRCKSKVYTQTNLKNYNYGLFLKYKARFQNICNSESMKYKLNYKILRWVKHFIECLKKKIKNKPPALNTTRSMNVIKKTGNISIRLSSKKNHPSSKIIKKQFDYSKQLQSQRSIEKDIEYAEKFNKVKIDHDKQMFRKFHSSGPKKIAISLVKVDSITKKITCSKNSIQLIIYIQSCWKRAIARIKFKIKLAQDRQKKSQQFKRCLSKLKFLYPHNIRINLNYVKKRIKLINRKTGVVFNPYIKHQKKILRKYIYFFQDQKINEQEIAKRYQLQTARKLKVKLDSVIQYAKNNMIDRLMKSGYIFTAKDLNILVDNKTVLHWAVHNANFQFARFLLQSGINPNIQDYQGNTVLHLTFKKKNPNMVTLLMQFGGDLNLTNLEGKTPLYYAPIQFLKHLGLESGIVSSTDNGNFIGDNNLIFFKSKEHEI